MGNFVETRHAVDTSGNVYVTGSSGSSVSPNSEDTVYTTIKYDSNGNTQWVTHHNGTTGYGYYNAFDNPTAITVDNAGNVYVTGGSGPWNNFDYLSIKYGHSDSDGDGIPDGVEVDGNSDSLNPASTPEICDGKDNNLNGLIDEGYEYSNSDSDGDGLIDCIDIDDDNDGLLDSAETNSRIFRSIRDTGTDSNNPDTDGDGIFDGYEVADGLNPLTANDKNFSDTDGDEWTDWQEFLAGTRANDPGSMPSAIQSVVYGWNSQVEFDLWQWLPWSTNGVVAQWVSSGGQDGSGYLHVAEPSGQWGEIGISEAHRSWFLSEGLWMDMRNNGTSTLHVQLYVDSGSGGVSKSVENGWYDQNTRQWNDLLPADGQWHRVWLQNPFSNSSNLRPGGYLEWGTVLTSLTFFSENGSDVSVDVDNLSSDCFYCRPLLGDTDNDGIANPNDNAPAIYNPDQRDTDGDGVGDVADAYPNDPSRWQSDPANPPTDGSANIGSGGGSFTTTDGTIDIQVPSGAVTTDTTVTVARDSSGQGLVVQTNSGQGELLVAYDFIPDGLTFAEPVTIVFHYSDLIDETNLGVYWYNPATGSYEQVVPYVQDTVANTLTVQVSHFSVYAVIRLLDTNPPTVGVTMNPPANAVGWHNTDVTVTFTCSDAESGIATCPTPIIVATEGAGQVISGAAIDKAGNTASTSVTINLDKTPPALFCPFDATIQATEPTGIQATDPSLQSFFIGAMADDNLDTVVSVSNNAQNFFLIGMTPVTFTATDDAGNQGACQAVVTVGNPPPVFDPIPSQVVDEGQSLIFVVSATDTNHNDLTYEASGLPSGATFDVTSRTFSYTPGYDVSTRLADSFFDVFFSVSDGTTMASQPVHITVRNVNRPPAASAGIDQQLACAGASCPIILDGSGSTDPDSSPGTQDDIAGYRWYEGYGTSAQQLLGTGKTISATLSLGNHAVTLEVTDQSGVIGTDTLTITLDPARLSMFVFEKAEIDWPKNIGGMADVKLHGRMALPVGLLQQELIPIELISLDLAGQSGVFAQTVNFEVKGGEGEKWEYKANPSGAGIQNLSIHWKGAKFDYKGTVHLKTEFIGLTETALSLDRESMSEPVTLSVNGETAVIDGPGTVTASVPYEIDEDGEVTFTLPFELKP